MCQQCDNALLAAATSADLLASAAQKLHSINETAASKVLSKAAADLFTEAPTETVVPGTRQSGQAGDASDETRPLGASVAEILRDLNATLPEGVVIGDDGILYVNSAPLGRVAVVKRPTRH